MGQHRSLVSTSRVSAKVMRFAPSLLSIVVRSIPIPVLGLVSGTLAVLGLFFRLIPLPANVVTPLLW